VYVCYFLAYPDKVQGRLYFVSSLMSPTDNEYVYVHQ